MTNAMRLTTFPIIDTACSRELCWPAALVHRAVVSLVVNGFDFWREKFFHPRAEGQHGNDERESESAKWFPRVNHFRKKMREGDQSADEIHCEIASDEILPNDSSVVITKDALHFRTEDRRGNPEREKNRGAEPNRRVESSMMRRTTSTRSGYRLARAPSKRRSKERGPHSRKSVLVSLERPRIVRFKF